MDYGTARKPEISTCKACGKLFPKVYVPLCGACVENEDNRFKLIRDYLGINKGASVPEISDATGLSRGDILRFQSDGRLSTVERGLEDGECTCASGNGRCDYCRTQLARDLKAQVDNPAARRTLVYQERPKSESNDDDGKKRVTYVRRQNRIDD